MLFTDLLRATVLLSGGSATAMIVVTLVAAGDGGGDATVRRATALWAAALLLGLWLSRRRETNPAIGRLLADARPAERMPELRPGLTVLNRLWPMLVMVVSAGAVATTVGAQVPALVAAVTMIWGLGWRRQAQAVTAIEERDGVTFFVARTAPWRAIKLERLPGFRRERIAEGGV
ncbi:MAG: hypothetical protein V9E83_09695 [Baekduia sp.]